MNVAMVLSGGRGSRFGSDLPKQYNMLLGKEVVSYSIEALKKSNLTDVIIVICDNSFAERLTSQYNVICIDGGSSRNVSLRKGLDYIKVNFPKCNKVFITEAARPFITAELVDKYFEYLDEYDGVITTKHITDSLGKYGEHVTMRDEYYLVQAPEAFRFDSIYNSFEADSPITATSQQLPANSKVMKHFDFERNMKITYPEDLLIAEQIMKLYNGENESEKQL